MAALIIIPDFNSAIDSICIQGLIHDTFSSKMATLLTADDVRDRSPRKEAPGADARETDRLPATMADTNSALDNEASTGEVLPTGAESGNRLTRAHLERLPAERLIDNPAKILGNATIIEDNDISQTANDNGVGDTSNSSSTNNTNSNSTSSSKTTTRPLCHTLTGDLNTAKNLLVFLHGFPNGEDLWDGIIDQGKLNKTDLCLTITLPNFENNVSIFSRRGAGEELPLPATCGTRKRKLKEGGSSDNLNNNQGGQGEGNSKENGKVDVEGVEGTEGIRNRSEVTAGVSSAKSPRKTNTSPRHKTKKANSTSESSSTCDYITEANSTPIRKDCLKYVGLRRGLSSHSIMAMRWGLGGSKDLDFETISERIIATIAEVDRWIEEVAGESALYY
jgi:hypothetical protein